MRNSKNSAEAPISRFGQVMVFVLVAGLAAGRLSAEDIGQPAPFYLRSNELFPRMHQTFQERGKSGPIGVLFLGDSITEWWSKAPEVWSRFYGKYQAANFGVSGHPSAEGYEVWAKAMQPLLDEMMATSKGP